MVMGRLGKLCAPAERTAQSPVIAAKAARRVSMAAHYYRRRVADSRWSDADQNREGRFSNHGRRRCRMAIAIAAITSPVPRATNFAANDELVPSTVRSE